ncbi:MAG: hypothetical protein M3N07_10305 [Pseudomonadota bacterium]|nr:hypothetical protein [Pseudomonadota bacterium]
MRMSFIGAAALALAAPAAGQQVFPPEMDEEIVRAIPPAEQVEAVGEVMDRVLGAVLDMPIGPIVDAIEAADPRGPRARSYDRSPRTLRDMAGRDDPYFEERMRDSIHGVAAGMGVMAEQMAVLAPAMRRSLAQIERDIARATDEARERREREERRGR